MADTCIPAPSLHGSPAPMGYREAVLCGRGATSRVYRATDVKTGRQVALKRLHRQLVQDGEALARLRRELSALEQVQHAGVVRVHDVVRWDGAPTLVMDFVPGEDLKERLLRGGPLPDAETLRIARWLLEVLAAVHGRGIVHRDLKPQNIRIDPEGGLHLLDFGSARLDAASQLTTTGSTVGTPEYMAPELFAGSVYDPRVDLYGAGATLHECVCGEPPQRADSLAELARLRQTTDVVPLAQRCCGVDPALALLVDRCLQRAPEDRFASASLALWALEHPAQARRMVELRSERPPCLHCGTAIAPHSTRCPACHSPSPWRYQAGGCHVEIESIKDAPALITHLVEQVPELGEPQALQGLAEHCAALSFSRQRLLSYVEREQAERMVARLRELGCAARVKIDPGMVLLTSGLLLVVAVPVYVTWMVFTWQIARRAMLARTLLRKPLWPRLAAGAWILLTTAVFGQSLQWLLAALGPDTPNPLSTTWIAALGALGSVVLAASALRMGTGRLAASPEPALGAQLKQHLRPWRSRAEREALPRPRTSRVTYAAFLLLFCAVVPLEAKLLFDANEALSLWRARRQLAQASPVRPVAPAPGQAAAGTAEEGTVAERTLNALAAASSPAPWQPALPALAAAVLIGLLLRRRRTVRRDGAAIYAELDLPRLRALGARPSPRRAQDPQARGTVQEQLEREARDDPFVREAVRRAADLLPLLPAASASRLLDGLRALQDPAADATAERALLARCVQDTQPDLHARLGLLELEGRLEAEAAQALLGAGRSAA
jgi:tRNA A-37 threonylcarbamoyl transferase component Bud32